MEIRLKQVPQNFHVFKQQGNPMAFIPYSHPHLFKFDCCYDSSVALFYLEANVSPWCPGSPTRLPPPGQGCGQGFRWSASVVAQAWWLLPRWPSGSLWSGSENSGNELTTSHTADFHIFQGVFMFPQDPHNPEVSRTDITVLFNMGTKLTKVNECYGLTFRAGTQAMMPQPSLSVLLES